MARRGRPRHPDILTPREWEVLALLRDGLSNEKIAERLDITVRTARYHVSEILSKLGVSSREKAASWRPEERRSWWATALAPVALAKRMTAAIFAGALVVGIGAVVGAIVWGMTRTDEDSVARVVVLPTSTDEPARACPTPGGPADIEYVDFVKFHGISYWSQQNADLAGVRLGPLFARVECALGLGIGGNPDYISQDGDAAYLAPGTPVYAVEGYDTTFRLAVRSPADGSIRLYEAFANPEARTGGDLLDIGGKLRYIGVKSEEDGVTELAAITEPVEVERLVALVQAAPIAEDSTAREGERYFIAFHLNDSTTVNRAYWLGTGTLSPTIVLPPSFGEAVTAALAPENH